MRLHIAEVATQWSQNPLPLKRCRKIQKNTIISYLFFHTFSMIPISSSRFSSSFLLCFPSPSFLVCFPSYFSPATLLFFRFLPFIIYYLSSLYVHIAFSLPLTGPQSTEPSCLHCQVNSVMQSFSTAVSGSCGSLSGRMALRRGGKRSVVHRDEAWIEYWSK